MSNTPHKDALTAEQYVKNFYDKRHPALIYLKKNQGIFIEEVYTLMEEYAALQQSKGNDLEPGPLQTL
jgi:hypothetical protein